MIIVCFMNMVNEEKSYYEKEPESYHITHHVTME